MNREKAQKVLEAYGRPQIRVENTVLTFARQTEDSLKEIEDKTDEELIDQWKALVYMNEIIGQVSLNELQRITLIELEFDGRKNINTAELKDWFDKETNDFDEEDFYGNL